MKQSGCWEGIDHGFMLKPALPPIQIPVDAGSAPSAHVASPAVAPPRRVNLQSDPVFLGTCKPTLQQIEINQRAAQPLADFKPSKHPHQVGSTSRPEVQDFFDQKLAGKPVEPARLEMR